MAPAHTIHPTIDPIPIIRSPYIKFPTETSRKNKPTGKRRNVAKIRKTMSGVFFFTGGSSQYILYRGKRILIPFSITSKYNFHQTVGERPIIL